MRDAAALARSFLSAIERRDAEACRSMMAPGIEMIFPGGVRHTAIEALFAASAKKYRFVGKTITCVDGFDEGDRSIVYVAGTLHGTWADGGDFDGIRFIDRFEVREGLIVRQDVWNDSAIFRPPPADAAV